jgi:hypothetical protein
VAEERIFEVSATPEQIAERLEMPAEMDHEMQMVWQAAWHRQSVVRHNARFKGGTPVSCEEAAWSAVVALIKGRNKAAARAALKAAP